MTAAEFKALFPQFTSETDDRVNTVIGLASPFFDVDRWGAFYPEGIANWVAHRIVVDNAEQAAPTDMVDPMDNVTESIGRSTSGRNPQTVSDEAYDPMLRTTYGRRYAYLRGLVGMGGLAVH